MNKPTLSLLFGVVLGAATFAIGYSVSASLSRKAEGFVAECLASNQKPVPADAPAWEKDHLVCEPRDLLATASRPNVKLVGVQASIAETQSAAVVWLERSRIVGVLLFALLALPYCWHFLLKRITELRQASVGR